MPRRRSSSLLGIALVLACLGGCAREGPISLDVARDEDRLWVVGEQRLSVNGQSVIEQTGMLWREAPNMVINDIIQPTYTHRPPEPGRTRTLWLDSTVLASRSTGPLVTAAQEEEVSGGRARCQGGGQ